jgi:hypothetical protein
MWTVPAIAGRSRRESQRKNLFTSLSLQEETMARVHVQLTSKFAAAVCRAIPVAGVLTGAANVAHAQLIPPAGNRVLWLAADKETTTSGTTVTQWNDAGQDFDWINNPVSQPTLTTATFANGTHSVIRFDGNDGFVLRDDGSLDLSSISIYMVGSVKANSISQVFMGNYADVAGYAVGLSDNLPRQTMKWFTTPPGPASDTLDNQDPNILTADAPYIITASLKDNGSSWPKELRLSSNGTTFTSTTTDNTTPIFYAGTPSPAQPTLGVLQGGRQWMTGDIAEILIYSDVSPAQNQAVEAYLNQKYYVRVPEPACFGLIATAALPLLRRRRN